MKNIAILLAVLLGTAASGAEKGNKEKEPASATAVSDLYPNDLGPAPIDVWGDPQEKEHSCKMILFACAACPTPARPINSQFIELSEAEQVKFKKSDPDLFKDQRLAHIEDKIWNRYVKRMMSKPGCPIKGDDGKKIWEFLVYDSKVRKTGANAAAWRKHRRKLLHEFAENYSDAYKKLFGAAPAPKED